MTIRPTHPNPAHGAGASESGGVTRRQPMGSDRGATAGSPVSDSSDMVQISGAARALQGRGTDVGTVDPTRLRTILERLQSGFYDRPDVIAVIAHGVAQDLDTA